jgi:hypothetical protein
MQSVQKVKKTPCQGAVPEMLQQVALAHGCPETAQPDRQLQPLDGETLYAEGKPICTFEVYDMEKKIGDSKRFLIGWGKGPKGRLCFFVSHKDISGSAVPRNPEDLVEYLLDCIMKIERK